MSDNAEVGGGERARDGGGSVVVRFSHERDAGGSGSIRYVLNTVCESNYVRTLSYI